MEISVELLGKYLRYVGWIEKFAICLWNDNGFRLKWGENEEMWKVVCWKFDFCVKNFNFVMKMWIFTQEIDFFIQKIEFSAQKLEFYEQKIEFFAQKLEMYEQKNQICLTKI